MLFSFMRYLFTTFVSVFILIAVLLPGSTIPDVEIIGFDKIVHVGMFGLWALVVRYDFRSPSFNFLLAFVIGMSFSVLTEVLQVFAESRTFDWFDVVADFIGLLSGLLVGSKMLALLKIK
jgi:VanZ family protein